MIAKQTKIAVLSGTTVAVAALVQGRYWPDAIGYLFAPGALAFMLLQGGVHERGFGAIFVVGTIFNIAIYSFVFWLAIFFVSKLKGRNNA